MQEHRGKHTCGRAKSALWRLLVWPPTSRPEICQQPGCERELEGQEPFSWEEPKRARGISQGQMDTCDGDTSWFSGQGHFQPGCAGAPAQPGVVEAEAGGLQL